MTAEELAVSCVTDIALKVERYNPARGGRFDSWVFTLAYHALVDWWRANPREISLPDDLAESLVFHEGEEPDPQALPDVVDAVRDAVARLPERDQALLRHRDLGDMTPYGDIAHQLGMREATVRVRHHRALLQLKSLLEPDPRVQRFLRRGPEASGDRNGRIEKPHPRRAPGLAG